MNTITENSTNTDLKYWITFSKIDGLGPINFFRLLSYFKNLKTAWESNYADLVAAGLKENLIQEIIIQKNATNPDNELQTLKDSGVGVVLFTDENYPKLLKETFSPPPMLFYRGEFKCLENNCLAVVGARKNTFYGQQVLQKIIPQLVINNITIVSGLALGIDGLAHQACLDNNGTTVAVLGSGVDKETVYPTSNRLLAEKIIATGGCLISEYAPGTPPSKQSFPLRNRIISGLSLGSLIIEAGESSGSLITAKYALEQNRDVFAVPGNIFSSKSKGTNNLIKLGAKLVDCAEDVLDELNIQQITQNDQKNNTGNATSEEITILKILSHEPTHIDKISQLCRIKINALSSLLVMMELNGLIKDTGGKNYIKNQN